MEAAKAVEDDKESQDAGIPIPTNVLACVQQLWASWTEPNRSSFSGAYRRSLAESSAKTISRIDAFWLQSQSQVPMPDFSPNSFSYRGSYFKLGAEGSQNFVDWLRGGLSYRASLGVSFGVCRGQGSQIQDRAVIEAVS